MWVLKTSFTLLVVVVATACANNSPIESAPTRPKRDDNAKAATPTPIATQTEVPARPTPEEQDTSAEFVRNFTVLETKDLKLENVLALGTKDEKNFVVALGGQKSLAINIELMKVEEVSFPKPITTETDDVAFSVSASEAWIIGKKQFTHIALQSDGKQSKLIAPYSKIEGLSDAPKLLGLVPDGFVSKRDNTIFVLRYKEGGFSVTRISWPAAYSKDELISAGGLNDKGYWFLSKERLLVAESVEGQYVFSEFTNKFDGLSTSLSKLTLSPADHKTVADNTFAVGVSDSKLFFAKPSQDPVQSGKDKEDKKESSFTFADFESHCGDCHLKRTTGHYQVKDESELFSSSSYFKGTKETLRQAALRKIKDRSMPVGAKLADGVLDEFVKYLSKSKEEND